MDAALPSKSALVKGIGSNQSFPIKPTTEFFKNGFFIVDQIWTVTYWNKAAEQVSGVLAKDIIGKDLWEKFAGSIPPAIYNTYRSAHIEDIPPFSEHYWAEKQAWFEIITFHDANSLSVSFKRKEQTEVKKSPAQQIKIQHALYKFVAEVMNDCLWEWDLDTKQIFWIDGGHKRLFGYPIENILVPQGFWEKCIHPEDRARVLERINILMSAGTLATWEEEYRFKKLDGEYAYVHDRGRIVYDDQSKSTRMIGATQDITAWKLREIRLLEAEKEERRIKQKEITEAVLTAQENERADIGKELHDNLNQVLGATKLYIELSKTDEENRQIYLSKASEYIVQVIEAIRKVSKTLASPGMIMGLFESINILLDDLTAIHPLRVDFHKSGIREADIGKKMQLDIFRILQEQLNNIVKHSGAALVTIYLSRKAKKIILHITDNGRGCDLSEVKKGVGIINIKSRVDQYRGKTIVESKPGKGYSLKVTLPLEGSKKSAPDL